MRRAVLRGSDGGQGVGIEGALRIGLVEEIKLRQLGERSKIFRLLEERPMASYTWIGADTGDWDDQSSWYNVSAGMSDDGYPGAGDNATVNATTVTVNDVTVANLNAVSTDIVGDITVTNIIESGVFSGGTVTAGTAGNIVFQGVSLAANTIDDGNLDAGTVTTSVFVFGAVDGATVSAQNIERDPSGQYALLVRHNGRERLTHRGHDDAGRPLRNDQCFRLFHHLRRNDDDHRRSDRNRRRCRN